MTRSDPPTRRTTRSSVEPHISSPRPAGANLAHLNDLLGDLTNSRLQFEAPDVEEDVEEYESDEDYVVPEEVLTAWAGAEISHEILVQVWRNQRGICPISHLPIDLASSGIYGGTLAPERISQPLSETNVRIVLTGISKMRDATGLPWSAFTAFLARVRPDSFAGDAWSGTT